MRQSKWWVLGSLLVTVSCSDSEAVLPLPEDTATCATLNARPSCLDEPDPNCLNAAADVVIDTTLSERNALKLNPPYGSTSCPGRLVIDIPASVIAEKGAWILNLWNDTEEIATEDACNQVDLNVWVYRQLDDGQWRKWDSYETLGYWDSVQWHPGACVSAMCNGGRLADGTTNDVLGFPWSWVSSEGADRLRVLVGVYGPDCEQRQLRFLAADNP